MAYNVLEAHYICKGLTRLLCCSSLMETDFASPFALGFFVLCDCFRVIHCHATLRPVTGAGGFYIAPFSRVIA